MEFISKTHDKFYLTDYISLYKYMYKKYVFYTFISVLLTGETLVYQWCIKNA